MRTYIRLNFDNASFPTGICDVFREIMKKRRYKDFELDIFYGGIVIVSSPYVYSEKDKSKIIIKTVGIAVEFRYAIKELKRTEPNNEYDYRIESEVYYNDRAFQKTMILYDSQL